MYTKRAGKYVSKRQSFKITLILFAPRFIKTFEKKNEKKIAGHTSDTPTTDTNSRGHKNSCFVYPTNRMRQRQTVGADRVLPAAFWATFRKRIFQTNNLSACTSRL